MRTTGIVACQFGANYLLVFRYHSPRHLKNFLSSWTRKCYLLVTNNDLRSIWWFVSSLRGTDTLGNMCSFLPSFVARTSTRKFKKSTGVNCPKCPCSSTSHWLNSQSCFWFHSCVLLWSFSNGKTMLCSCFISLAVQSWHLSSLISFTDIINLAL